MSGLLRGMNSLPFENTQCQVHVAHHCSFLCSVVFFCFFCFCFVFVDFVCLRPLSCVPNVDSVSGLSILDRLFGFLLFLFAKIFLPPNIIIIFFLQNYIFMETLTEILVKKLTNNILTK